MTQSPEIDASASELILRCEAEMAGFAAERDACVKRCRELMAAENPEAGVFHAAEIYKLQKDKLRLEVEMEFKRKKINRIRLGIDESSESEPGPSAGGFAL